MRGMVNGRGGSLLRVFLSSVSSKFRPINKPVPAVQAK